MTIKQTMPSPAFASYARRSGSGPQGAARVTAWIGFEVMTALDAVAEWHRRANDRRMLGTMDERLLRDIGCSRIDAELESTKPFWRR